MIITEGITIDLSPVMHIMELIARVYQHERCPPELQAYILFEMKRNGRRDLDWKSFLEGRG